MRQNINIAVLANRGNEQALKTWQLTADYLTDAIPGYRFNILALDFEAMSDTVQRHGAEFIITNSGMYVEFETLYGVNRIATRKHLRLGRAYSVFGGVIFCSAERHDIQSLSNLRGKHLIAVDEHSLGGWRMAWREIVEAGINPYRDFQSLRFGGSHDAVVWAIQQGNADVGTIATDVLERLAADGQLTLDRFHIINPQTHYGQDFPFALSTRLYPEWPFAAARHTPADLATEVAIALLQLPKDSPAARAANSEGWTIPLNYQPVHECFQVLQLKPYKEFGKTTSSFELAVKGSNDGLWDWNLETNEVFYSPRWKAMLGYGEDELDNRFEVWQQRLHPEDRDRVLTRFQQSFDGHLSHCDLEYRLQHRDGQYRWVLCRSLLLRDVHGNPYRMAGSHTDITKRKHAEENLRQSELHLKEQAQQLQQALSDLQQTQLQLIHSEKMSSLGQLVAGIAHEINNPVNFIYGNLNYLELYVRDVLTLLQSFQGLDLSGNAQLAIATLQSKIETLDLNFLVADLPNLLASMKVGTERIYQIVLSLRNFSRLDESEMKSVDIHEGINNTLLILQHRLKPKPHLPAIAVKKHYGDIPPVDCYPGQLNQVFMNILSNAIDALEEKLTAQSLQTLQTSLSITANHHATSTRNIPSNRVPTQLTQTEPTIHIYTQLQDHNRVSIHISDNGIGMADSVQSRIFDPFYTTKPVGQGTGLGLSISYKIIVEQHRGQLKCQSMPGQGTTFEVEIPLHHPAK
ncbi:MAG TPA: PhnD/SsuA/transferrin family substrate-binding protein [Chroococcidiopsis sp.]